MGFWIRDLRQAARRLAKSRSFFLTVILMLALGIGATTTIFSLIEGILLRPLPFRDPGRLVQLGEHVGENSGIGITARDIRAYSTEAQAFSSMGAFAGASFALSGGPSPENIPAARLTSGVFPTLGVEPLLGRVFSRQEEDARAQVAVISYALWTNRYHRDARAVGATIELDRKPYTIIGVMPRDFEFPLQAGRLNQAQLWVPMSLSPAELSEGAAGFWGYQMVARLKDGVSRFAGCTGCGSSFAADHEQFSAFDVQDPHPRRCPIAERRIYRRHQAAASRVVDRSLCGSVDCLRQRRNSHAGASGPLSSRIRGSPRARRPLQFDLSRHCSGRTALESQRRIARFSLCRDCNPRLPRTRSRNRYRVSIPYRSMFR